MPQLDASTFLSQVFWLSVFFFTFYLIVLKNILPVVGRMIKVRSKKIDTTRENIAALENEQNQITRDYETIMTKSLQESADLLNRTNNTANAWVKETEQKTNSQKTSSDFNGAYIKTVGDITGKKRLILNCVNL